MLTLEDPHRFRKSRDVGSYLGLQPGRRNSGQSEPQMHISKEGDPYLRTLLVQGAQHILGPFGVDCDLRRWGLNLAERGRVKPREGKQRSLHAMFPREYFKVTGIFWMTHWRCSGVSGAGQPHADSTAPNAYVVWLPDEITRQESSRMVRAF